MEKKNLSARSSRLRDRGRAWLAPILGLGVLAVLAWATLGERNASSEVYVPPGQYDQAYAFLSGGHAGSVFVYGIPSGRLINIIPVFSPYSKTGWGYDVASKKMMGGFTWGDAHHPSLSQTDGRYDGRWLFINDNANARIARIDLKTFTTAEIYGPIPNISGLHASTWLTPNSHYAMAATRFSVPLPIRTYAPAADYPQRYDGAIAGIRIDPQSGHMSMGWEIRMPPIDFDLAQPGKGISAGYAFFTSYNTEEAHDDLEINASQHDRDLVAMVNYRLAQQATDAGKGHLLGGVRVLDPKEIPGLVYFVPAPKSPHGVDVTPDGKYICVSGKLAPVVSVDSFPRIQRAIARKDFEGTFSGIPVVRYTSANVAEVPVGLGPLHTQFDDKGYAYTSLFVDSAIAKWQIGTWKVVQRVPVTYNIGHLSVMGGDTMHPYGKWLLALNKLSKDRFIGTGPDYPTDAQLFDISGPKMRLLLDFPTLGEPHYGVMIPASMLHPAKIYDLTKNDDPTATKREDRARVVRSGNRVDVYMTAIRSHFSPDNLSVEQGDKVFFHVTNLEQDENIAHGFAITFSNLDMEVAPGETKTVEYDAD
ncbi:MAG: Sec-dependent nitrous-oxide reductase, partial [Cyanobacteria bacterium REEB65]|nr:Sec-dependent nitrous-oxide reductase [Cyanobacteria bacterium REEB65]